VTAAVSNSNPKCSNFSSDRVRIKIWRTTKLEAIYENENRPFDFDDGVLGSGLSLRAGQGVSAGHRGGFAKSFARRLVELETDG
jgi:hypothetical protein